MENTEKLKSIAGSISLSQSPAMVLCRNFISNIDNYKDVRSARESLIGTFRETVLCGSNSCGFTSPFGFIRISSEDDNICEVAFTDELCPLEPRGELAVCALWLSEYFARLDPEWFPKIRLQGTGFRHEVWKQIDEIPLGKTKTYGELAEEILREHPGSVISAQAVGGAISRNPLAILRPCHRVIGSDGTLKGYAWGVDRKRSLLEFEGVHIK